MTYSTSKKTINDEAGSEDDMAQVRARRAAVTSKATKNKTPATATDQSNGPHTSRRTEDEHEAAHKKVSVCVDSGEDLPEVLSTSRNGPEPTTHVSLTKARRTKHEAAHKVAARVDSDEEEAPLCTSR